MCSIEGFTGPQPFTIEDYTKFNKDRGPDATNHWDDGIVHLGHNLLAIAPQPTNKSQPFETDKGNVLCYNGEIFGLDQQIYDTEWLANKIENEGIQSLKHGVNGMWAFSWYDIKQQKVYLVRDHFGVKPLFYMEVNGNLYWSSTTKPLIAALNKFGKFSISDKNFDLFQNQSRFLPCDLTPYEHIKKLSPGEIKIYNLNTHEFEPDDNMWSINSNVWNLDMDLKWDPEEFDDKVKRCFQEVYFPGPKVNKTVSLSGGLDSTLILSVLRPHRLSATSCSWEDDGTVDDQDNVFMIKESELAERTCQEFGKEFYKSTVPHDFNHLMKETYYAMGMPVWDRNRLIPRYVNCKHAAQNRNKVYIVGDCADEMLTGYNGDFNTFYPKHAKKRNWNKQSIDERWRPFIPTHLFGNDHINNYLFYRTLMEGESFCVVADHLAGRFGMESRVPFLHQDLAKYIFKIPGVYKLHVPFKHDTFAKDYKKKKEQRFWRMGNWKSMLRDHMTKYYPKHILERGRKTGFANPWDARDDVLNRKYAEADTKLSNMLNKKLTFND